MKICALFSVLVLSLNVAVGQAAEVTDRIAPLVEQAIAAKQLPGAVVLVGRGEQILYRKAFGYKTYSPSAQAVTPDTVFDLASLTKPLVTATLIIQLAEQGQLRLTDPVGKYLDQLKDPALQKVTLLQLLTHSSGLDSGFNRSEFWQGRKGLEAQLAKLKLKTPPDQQFVYSDIGFILLGLVVEQVAQQPLNTLAQQQIFKPLTMKDSRYLPLDQQPDAVYLQRIAPTESLQGDPDYKIVLKGYAQPYLHGVVHDPTAMRLGGVAGHAGLFSTADDVARFAQMLVNHGELKGQRVLSPLAVKRMQSPVQIGAQSRALGWDLNTSYSTPKGDFFPASSFGHTGFTGTSVWIDPNSGTYVILLSNRVHPDRSTSLVDLRAKLANIVAAGIRPAL